MEEVNKNTELENTDKKLHISDVIPRYKFGTVTSKYVPNHVIESGPMKGQLVERTQMTISMDFPPTKKKENDN